MGRLRAQKEQMQRGLTRVSDEGKDPLPSGAAVSGLNRLADADS